LALIINSVERKSTAAARATERAAQTRILNRALNKFMIVPSCYISAIFVPKARIRLTVCHGNIY